FLYIRFIEHIIKVFTSRLPHVSGQARQFLHVDGVVTTSYGVNDMSYEISYIARRLRRPNRSICVHFWQYACCYQVDPVLGIRAQPPTASHTDCYGRPVWV